MASLADRLVTRSRVMENGCIEWGGAQNGVGYGVIRLSKPRRMALTHRVAFEMKNGPIPAGLQLDHLCRNPLCMNVEHLEAVTPRTNVLRGRTIVANQAARTVCAKGHAYNEMNTYVDKQGKRHCRACDAARHRRARRRDGEDDERFGVGQEATGE